MSKRKDEDIHIRITKQDKELIKELDYTYPEIFNIGLLLIQSLKHKRQHKDIQRKIYALI